MKITNPVSYQIWKDRYCKNNETVDDNLYRVAKFCGNNPKETDDFFNILNEGRFVVGGRTMSNAGIGSSLTLNNCFIEGSKVVTKRGLVNIENVKIGDEVITHNNTWQKVNDVMIRDYEGDLYKISGSSILDDIICTPNHKFLTQNGWKRADRLLYGGKQVINADRLKIANFKFNKVYNNNTIDITENFTPPENKRLVINEEENTVHLEVFCRHSKHSTQKSWGKRGYSINRFITLDEDFRYFIGRWIGDGSVTSYKEQRNPSIIQIVFNINSEKEASERCKKIGTEKFGIEPTVTYTKQNVIALRWSNEILGAWFKNEFGEKCDGKHLSEKYIGDFEIAKGLLDADSSISTHGSVKIVLKNKQLIFWLRDTLYLNGINTQKITKSQKYEETYMLQVSTYIGKGRLNQHLSKTYFDQRQKMDEIRELYTDYVVMDDIEVLENKKCKVYNISVENAHSYTINGVVVHNCFTLNSVPDSIDGIFDTVRIGALTQKAGGGTGYDYSLIRPNGTPTKNDAIASGVVSFMQVFNTQTATILQGNRRGANMGILNIYHPDIFEYLDAKSFDAGTLVHFNLSVMIDDDFMNAVENNEDIYLHYPVYDEKGHIIKDENEWQVKKKQNAKELYDLIIKKAYDTGEYGVFFYDNLNKDNNTWYCETIIGTNPLAI